jgi:hypothetical protein
MPPCLPVGYKFNSNFQRQVNQFILAEGVLRSMTWSLLRTLCLPDHNLLTQTLTIEQLKQIHLAKTMCNIISVLDRSPAWETLISNIGQLLISRAMQSFGRCSSDSKIDVDKEALSKWYNTDYDYALVALCNVLKPDGSVDIYSLTGQIKARSTSGIRYRYVE